MTPSRCGASLAVIAATLLAAHTASQARELTFAQRVAAQRAIEVVYYAHRTEAHRSFAEAVPPELLERKVRSYLEQSAALENQWQRPITAHALERELGRMAQHTMFPERLEEIYAALGHDPFLVQECFVRPVLAARWTGRLPAEHVAESGWERVQPVARESALLPSPRDSATCPAADTWFNGMLDDTPTQRTRHTAVWTGTEMIVWGGRANAYTNSGGRYDPLTDSWTPMTRVNAPSPRPDHTAVWTGTEMIVWGGRPPSGVNTGGRYDPQTDTWTPTSTTNAPAGRWSHSAVWTGSQMIVWGGASPSGMNTGGRYDPLADAWTPTTTSGAPAARYSHAGVWTGSQMIVFGGSAGSTGGRYDPLADAWTPLSTLNAPPPRYETKGVWSGAELLLWPEAARYDPAADAWVNMSTVGDPPDSDQPIVWTGSAMIVWSRRIGLSLETWAYANTGARYDPAADTWTPTGSAGAPTGRSNFSAVWTGTEVIVWGGDLGNQGATGDIPGFLNTGGRYDPFHERWTPMSGPYSYERSTAVWTGNEMIVWGGADGWKEVVESGARYDAVTDSWTPTSLADAPEARANHSAVWTGDEMIVWGGVRYTGDTETIAFSSGGRYDPLSDTWSPTSTTGAPTAREQHAAIWTGDEMVVWGGGSGTTPAASGGRYDPATDSWLALSALDAPAPRFSPTAVWTGAELIVWGGRDGLYNELGSGGRWDPRNDSWSPVTTSHAPMPRRGHTAVWSGSEMIVWGGLGDADLNDGGRYDPLSDVWTATATTAAPSPRSKHTAVWTGDEMVVWGGSDVVHTGGVYDPANDAWTPTSTMAAPPANAEHKAIWSGTAMIVWGGRAGVTGGRYFPTNSVDGDFDGRCDFADCDDSDGLIWQTPGEVAGLGFADAQTLVWDSPATPGGLALLYDTLRSAVPSDFLAAAEYVEADGADTESSEPATPSPGGVAYYLVRAENGCPLGSGPLGD